MYMNILVIDVFQQLSFRATGETLLFYFSNLNSLTNEQERSLALARDNRLVAPVISLRTSPLPHR